MQKVQNYEFTTMRSALRTLTLAMAACIGLFLLHTETSSADEDLSNLTSAPSTFMPSGAAPIQIAIPSISVSAQVVPVGLDNSGAMASPGDPDDVAWYSLGPGVGGVGNAVLAGHVDWAGSYRVFGLLSWLKPGDDLAVWDSNGNEYRFAVEWAQWIRADEATVEGIFGQGERGELTLITCGGQFDQRRREYLDRFVVRAQLL